MFGVKKIKLLAGLGKLGKFISENLNLNIPSHGVTFRGHCNALNAAVSIQVEIPIHFNIWVKNIWQGHLEEGNMENTESSIA